MTEQLAAIPLPEPDIRKLQQIELGILNRFSEICKKYHLAYFITAGTLLGAVRHQGFIPWDDDIDVAMPRKDYNRLRKICRKHLDGQFFFQDHRTEPDYPFYFAKIRRKNTEVCEESLIGVQMDKGIYIDIFPLDRCPRSELGGKLFFKGIELLNCALMAKVNPSFSCGYSKRQMRMLFALLKRCPKPLLACLREGLRWLCSWGGRFCTVGGAHGYPREAYRKEWFASCVQLEFEGESYPAPSGWHELLSHMYGDYRKPPEEQEKTGHFISWGVR